MRTPKLLILFLCIPVLAAAQQPHDTGVFIRQQAGYYQNHILKGVEDFNKREQTFRPRTYFSADFTGIELHNEIKDYTSHWRQPPISQGNTGTCWSYGSTAMAESEIWRLTGKSVKLSEMYTVYWEYVERARDFVRTKGETYFAQGSEAAALPKIMKTYGAVPYEAYSGMLPGQKVQNHQQIVNEMLVYLGSVKNTGAWDEEVVAATIISILDHYMGKPPLKFMHENKEYTPQTFLSEHCKLNPSDYYNFMSTMTLPYNQKGELVEDDNWWHCDDYYNVSIDDFLLVAVNAVKNGNTLCICGDVSEPGFSRETQCGIIPSFDIPSAYIDENARQMRLSNATTTDDHCMQLIGYKEVKGKFWFLLKDSGSGAFDGKHRGYRFIHEDYVKLKMMNILVHKEAARPVLDKIIK